MRARTVLPAALAVSVLAASFACGRKDRATPETLRAEIAALERERETLRGRLDELIVADPRLEGMPKTPVRVGVPTTLARDLIQRVVSGFVDQVTLELRNIRVRKGGTVRRIVTIGHYDLNVIVNRVTGKLKAGEPEVRFGGNKVSLALPVTVASGTGRATIHFKWNGRNVSGAVCGDMDITQEVMGSVRPESYPVSGGLVLTSTAKEILAEPRFPVVRFNLKVVPSDESWRAVQKILDEKEGVCGFVLGKVDVLGLVKKMIDKGFDVRLPTEKIKPMAVPVGIEPTMEVRGEPVALGIKVGGLAITEHVIWLGAHVSVTIGGEAVTKKASGMGTADPKPPVIRSLSRVPPDGQAPEQQLRGVHGWPGGGAAASSSRTAATAGSTAAATAGVIPARNSSTLSASIATMRTSDGME
jgi:hypothetical protein